MWARPDEMKEKRLLTEREATSYVGMGRTRFRSWADQNGVVRRFGKSVRYDLKAIDEILDKMAAIDTTGEHSPESGMQIPESREYRHETLARRKANLQQMRQEAAERQRR